MGAAHSRARPGTGPTKGVKFKSSQDRDNRGDNDGYFILCLKNGDKTDKIKVVNASGSVHKLLQAIIGRNSVILKSGWDRHLVFSYKLQKSTRNRHSLIQLTAELLLTLYRMGWEPMTPIDLPGGSRDGGNSSNQNGQTDGSKVVNMQTAICFRRGKNNNASQEHLSSMSYDDIQKVWPNTMGVERHDCLCLETFSENHLGFHDVPNTLLLDLVQCVSADWQPGLLGISEAVYSVISDYSTDSDMEVLSSFSAVDDRKYLQLRGSPWSQSEEGADLEDAIESENLTLSLIACLARAQYKLQISINMNSKTRVFFFIKDKENREVRLPTFCGVGLGDKNSLYVYQPTITRTQTSFFRSRNKNRGKSIRKRIQASFRRKSARDKQKHQKHHCELEYSTASNNVEKSEKSAASIASGSATGQVTFESPQISRQNSTHRHSGAPRKSSAFLTVNESLRHLSISGEASSTEEEETTTG